jgi:hypothetical protein
MRPKERENKRATNQHRNNHQQRLLHLEKKGKISNKEGDNENELLPQ